MSPLLRRGQAAQDSSGDVLVEDPETGAVKKGRATPSQREARAARAAQAKGAPRTRKEEAARRRELSAQMREAMKSTDVSKLPPAQRVPELVLTRDLVDSRRNLGSAAVPVLILYFLSTILVASVAPSLSTPFFFLAVLWIVGIFSDSFIMAAKAEGVVQRKFPGSKVKIKGYVVRRAISVKRFRRPPAVVGREDFDRLWKS